MTRVLVAALTLSKVYRHVANMPNVGVHLLSVLVQPLRMKPDLTLLEQLGSFQVGVVHSISRACVQGGFDSDTLVCVFCMEWFQSLAPSVKSRFLQTHQCPSFEDGGSQCGTTRGVAA